jgi:hypothetical protein
MKHPKKYYFYAIDKLLTFLDICPFIVKTFKETNINRDK